MKKSQRKESVNEQIYARIEKLDATIGDPEEDAKEIENIKALVECKEKLEKPKFDISWGSVISSVLGFLGIVTLISHERDGVIASKVTQLIPISRFFK